jgi:PBP1b-binding outer membrane lipoprotein LpoB
MKKVIVLAAIAAVFASCASDNKSNSGLLGGDSATVTIDSTVVDSVAFESMVQDTLATN